MQTVWRDGRLLVGALDGSALQCLPDPFGSLIVISLIRLEGAV
jgi:hypothetical protein